MRSRGWGKCGPWEEHDGRFEVWWISLFPLRWLLWFLLWSVFVHALPPPTDQIILRHRFCSWLTFFLWFLKEKKWSHYGTVAYQVLYLPLRTCVIVRYHWRKTKAFYNIVKLHVGNLFSLLISYNYVVLLVNWNEFLLNGLHYIMNLVDSIYYCRSEIR